LKLAYLTPTGYHYKTFAPINYAGLLPNDFLKRILTYFVPYILSPASPKPGTI